MQVAQSLYKPSDSVADWDPAGKGNKKLLPIVVRNRWKWCSQGMDKKMNRVWGVEMYIPEGICVKVTSSKGKSPSPLHLTITSLGFQYNDSGLTAERTARHRHSLKRSI